MADPGEPLAADTVPGAFQHIRARCPDRVVLQTTDGATQLTWREAERRSLF